LFLEFWETFITNVQKEMPKIELEKIPSKKKPPARTATFSTTIDNDLLAELKARQGKMRL